MNRLRSLIIESLQTPKKKDCNCGCGGCSTGNLGPILNENKAFINPLSTDLQYHIDNNRPLTEHLYRAGSDSYFALFAEARNLYSRNVLKISNTDDLEILKETDLGHFGMFEGKKVPLDFPMVNEEEEYYVTVNRGHGDGKRLVRSAESDYEEPRVFSKEEAEEYVKRVKSSGATPGRIASYWVSDRDMNRIDENEDKLSKIKQELEALRPGISWIDDIFISSYDGSLRVELDYTLYPNEIKQLAQIATKYGMELKYMTGKNASLVKDKINENKKKAKKKGPKLNKPMRSSSGGKAYKVYVKDPKTGNVKTVRFGSGGLRAKINDRKARQAFAKRHKCSTRNDKTKASYWSCRLPRYAKLLGLKSTFSGFW